MRLIAYRLRSFANIRPAATRRDWMDAWPKKHPYHCLPLAAANSYGWEMVCGTSFDASWNGGNSKRAVRIAKDENGAEPYGHSHFGYGVLTFFTGCLLRTEDPFQLFVTGPLNNPKRGLFPLSAIIETSWLPYTFAMSFVFTEPDISVRFEKDEPFCQFFPLQPKSLESIEPTWLDLDSDPSLRRQYREWSFARKLSNGELERCSRQKPYEYQHYYQRGVLPSGAPIVSAPPTRYKVPPFSDQSNPTSVSAPTSSEQAPDGSER